MKLVYNVEYEVVAAVFVFICYIYLCYQGTQGNARLVAFRKMVLYVFIGGLMDVLSAIAISYGAYIPHIINMIVNTMFLVSTVNLCIQYSKYIVICVDEKRGTKSKMVFNHILYYIYLVIMLANFWLGNIFYVTKEGEYTHGPYFILVCWMIPFYYLIYASVVLLKNRELFLSKHLFALLSCNAFCFIGEFMQTVWFQDTLIGFFGISLSVPIMMLTVETQDYRELIKTMNAMEQAREQAQSANMAKSNFLANMSHEIRTPINAILGIADMIVEESDTQNESPLVKEYGQDIRSAGKELLELVNNILTYSKLESGKLELFPVKYNLTELLTSLYQTELRLFSSTPVQFFLEVDPETANELYGDEVQIRQVVGNFVSNAVKYTKQGNVWLRVNYKPLDEEYILLEFSVEDTGIGIDEENIDRIFNSFERVQQDKGIGIQGTGLGLAICKRLSDMMEGTVSVHSKPDEGSTFSFSLPQRVLSEKRIGYFNPVVLNRETELYGRILVVDDTPLNLKVFLGMIKGTDIIADICKSGEECLKRTEEQDYQLIFLDYMMPVMDGEETLKHIKKGKNKNTPVIMLTAQSEGDLRDNYIKMGFSEYLSKPFEKNELMKLLERFLADGRG